MKFRMKRGSRSVSFDRISVRMRERRGSVLPEPGDPGEADAPEKDRRPAASVNRRKSEHVPVRIPASNSGIPPAAGAALPAIRKRTSG